MAAAGRAGDVARGLWGLARLVAVVAGLPVALVVLVAVVVPGSGGWPLPRALPTAAELGAALGRPGTLPVAVVARALALLGWAAWAELVLAVVLEVAARPLGRPAPRLRLPLAGVAQPGAARLVAAVALLSALWWSPPRPALAHPAGPAGAATAPGSGPAGTYVVRPGDWLSTIARDHLGDWRRYPELFAANAGRPQPDGGALVDEDLIRPGWVLALPAPAPGPLAAVPAPEAVDTPAPVPVPEALDAPPPPSPPLPAPAQSTPAAQDRAPAEPVQESSPAPAEGAEGAEPAGGGLARAAALAGVGLPGLVAAAVARKLWRERQAQQRRRRRGRDVPRPEGALEPLERRIRAVAATEALEWVDAGLRYLWRALAKEGPTPPPAVEAVRVGAGGLEILLDRVVDDLGRFGAADEGRVWRLDPEVDLEDLRALADDEGPLVPALVTVGASAEGAVLVDLERAGTLAVEGDPERVAAFLAGAALELGCAPWAFDVVVKLVGGDARLGALELVEVAEDPGALLAAGWPQPDLGGAPSTLAARLAGDEAHAPTVVVVAPGAAPAEVLEALVARARPATSGLVVVAPGPLAGVRWRLRIAASAAAVLDPLGLELVSAPDADTVAGAAELLAAARRADDGGPLVAEAEPEPAPSPVPFRGGAETGAPAPEPLEVPEVLVRVLGPVEVPWARPPERRLRAEELVAYLATRGATVAKDQLRTALHPLRDDARAGEVSDATFRGEVSRARAALGADPSGQWYLPHATRDGYRLGMASDWLVFRSLVRAARSHPGREADLLRRALALVRGAPFEGVPEGSFAWALSGPLVTDIEVAVAEAAERLIELALDAGDPATARWAARQGLLVVPGREDLYQGWMRAAAAAGDLDDLELAWRGVGRAVRALDPLEEPRPDTARLYRQLRERGRHGTANGATGARPGSPPQPSGTTTVPG